jgi:tetratricopeptide (TPR) repeat protein
MAKTARLLEDAGAYARAAEALRALRARVKPDADLDLALAIDLARAGYPDSAATLLWTPRLDAALADSLPYVRRGSYGWERQSTWLNGRFDGWNWYVARARTEVAAALGRWSDAYEGAMQCVAARSETGREWLAAALCAAHLGQPGEARVAAHIASSLDPMLPEAFYLEGVCDWRAGLRTEAQACFRSAVALDSTWSLPALALVRSRLVGAPPDSFPAQFLFGIRQCANLVSPMQPKLEEFVQMDMPVGLLHRGLPPALDTLTAGIREVRFDVTLLIDERGRAVLSDLPWFPESVVPPIEVAAIIQSLKSWQFRPAMKNGVPRLSWAAAAFSYNPFSTPPAPAPHRH